MNQLLLFSVFYLIVASMSLNMGYYALRLAPGEALNRIFLLICACLAFWAFGLAIVIVAPNESTAAIWTRVSAVGYETVYSLLLHFTLLLTGRKHLFRHRWFYAVLYLPAGVCLYGFVFSTANAQELYRFVYGDRGWIRDTPLGVWDQFFHVYYGASVLISLLLLLSWKHNQRAGAIRHQANLMLSAFLVAFVLGTMTDILNGQLMQLPIPLLAPAWFLIPLSAILYCIRNFHFMKPHQVNAMELILSDKGRLIVLRIALFILIPAGAVLQATEYWKGNTYSFALTVISMAGLLAAGSLLFIAGRKSRGSEFLEFALILSSLTMIPLLMINMLPYGGFAVLMFPLIILLCAMIFNSDHLLLASAVPVLLSDFYLAVVKPQDAVTIKESTYFSMAFLFLLVVLAAYMIHHIYVARLKENALQTRTERLISDIAAEFSLNGKGDPAQIIHNLLKRLADYFTADTTQIHAIGSEFNELIDSQQYTIDGRPMTSLDKQQVMERWAEYLCQTLETSETLSSRSMQDKLQPDSWLFIPIYMGGRTEAFFYIESNGLGRGGSQELMTPLPVISRIVSDALETRFMAYYDNLTKLPNRRLFYDRSDQALRLARRSNRIVGIAFLDLDSFKSINDTMGHEGGDQLIQAVSQKLLTGFRSSDTVSRFGGDEFLILLNGVSDIDDISIIADKILKIFEEPFMINDQEIFVTASCGIAVYPADGEDAETMIKHADIAMYSAKEKGKNQYAFCSVNMKETVQHRVTLSNSLHRALERNELLVHYQPQVDLQTGQIAGFEALVRWRHPTHGLIPPSEFIPLAEQSGLIHSIGSWVLETACRQLADWRSKGFGDMRIAVNLSVVQLRNPSLTAQVEEILRRTATPPQLVELEITESATIKEPDYIVGVLNNLKNLGVSISIDDFGTEYSSLNRLKLLPIDRLKMDMQFVHGIDKNPKDRAISLVIMSLAKNLDLKLVAEGVESSTQLEFLKQRMCDEVQGYYYYKPMPAAEIETVLRQKQLTGNDAGYIL
ncbi:MAG: hypothetical protein K0Q73_5976 [Paenibacillus sp.]|nr:hypothetical protein [Paenibacillus sp.]